MMGLFRLDIITWGSCDNLSEVLEEDYSCQFLLGPKEFCHFGLTDTFLLIFSVADMLAVWSFWKTTIK